MSPDTRQPELDHLAPLIRRQVDGLADLAVMKAAGIYVDRAVSRRDRLQALLALLGFASRGARAPGSREARLILSLAQSKHPHRR